MTQRLTNEQLHRLAFVDYWGGSFRVGNNYADHLLYTLGLIVLKKGFDSRDGGDWCTTEAGEEALQEGIGRLAFHVQDTVHPEHLLNKFIDRIDDYGELAALLVHPLKEVRKIARQRFEYLKDQEYIIELVNTWNHWR